MWEIKFVQHVPTINICSALHQDQKLSNYQVCTSLVIKQVWKCNPQHFLANPFLTNLRGWPLAGHNNFIFSSMDQTLQFAAPSPISSSNHLNQCWIKYWLIEYHILYSIFFFSEQGKFYIFSVLLEPPHWWQKCKVTCWFCFAFCDLI